MIVMFPATSDSDVGTVSDILVTAYHVIWVSKDSIKSTYTVEELGEDHWWAGLIRVEWRGIYGLYVEEYIIDEW